MRPVALGVVAALCAASVLSGCAKEGRGYTRVFADERSFQLKDERVTIDFRKPKPESETESFTGAAVATLVVGAVVDFAEKQIRKEAGRYTQSYSAERFTPEAQPGIWITREAMLVGRAGRDHRRAHGQDRDEQTLATAAEIQIVAEPVLTDGRVGKWNDKSAHGMYRLHVESVTFSYPKTKVRNRWFEDEVIDLAVVLSVEGTWLSGNDTLEKHTLVSGGTAIIKKLRFNGERQFPKNKNNERPLVGYLYIPQDVKGLVLRYSAVVTESDPTKTSEWLIDGADLLEENKDSIVGAAVKAAGLEDSAAPADPNPADGDS